MKHLHKYFAPAGVFLTAARFRAPGIVAHQSALRDGEKLAIPDFGEPPVNFDIMDIMNIEKEVGKPPIEL